MREPENITSKDLDIKIERLNLRDGDSIVVTVPEDMHIRDIGHMESFMSHYFKSRGLRNITGPIFPKGIRIEREHGDDEMTDLIRDLLEC